MRELIQKYCQPLEPIQTTLEPQLTPLPGIRCLAFDLYGTLLISASGGEESLDQESTLRSLLAGSALPNDSLIEIFHQLISEDHAKSRRQGIEFPEVDILEIWEHFFERLNLPKPDLAEFAMRYELQTNPVWPMPGLDDLPKELPWAVISNAQFYTPLLVEELCQNPFENDLTFYSYRNRQAKPGLFLFQQLAKSLKKRNIAPSETLYLGNDHQKDIIPAKKTGFRSVLFAGDKCSLRTSPELEAPDAIITHLSQLPSLFT